MNDHSITATAQTGPIPADDPARNLSVIDPDAQDLAHIGVVGDTYTVLLSGSDTAGKFCLIDMAVPKGGGPGPHRHDFEEMYHVLEGEIEFSFRGEKQVVKAGMTVNIPANAPHSFSNTSGNSARTLCMCAPAGQEEFFMAIGAPVGSRAATPPKPSKEQQETFMKKAEALAPRYRTELLKP